MECPNVRLERQKIISYQKKNDTISCLYRQSYTPHSIQQRESGRTASVGTTTTCSLLHLTIYIAQMVYEVRSRKMRDDWMAK